MPPFLPKSIHSNLINCEVQYILSPGVSSTVPWTVGWTMCNSNRPYWKTAIAPKGLYSCFPGIKMGFHAFILQHDEFSKTNYLQEKKILQEIPIARKIALKAQLWLFVVELQSWSWLFVKGAIFQLLWLYFSSGCSFLSTEPPHQ